MRESPGSDAPLVQALGETVHPLYGAREDDGPLFDCIGDARIVLLGEASHGTHEFYRERARITQRLVEKHGFHAVAVGADWPAAHRVHRYVRGQGEDTDAVDALGDFRRFPAWMWRNAEVLDFVGWLRAHNEAWATGHPVEAVGFYGLDLYSLHSSIEHVLDYLARMDPEAARRARARYGCFGPLGAAGAEMDPQRYGYATTLGLTPSCEDEVVAQLVELQRRRSEFLHDGVLAEDEFFQAEQNARLVTRAEAYYRTLFQGHVASWNLRDTHMADMLDSLLGHLDQRPDLKRGRARVVVWAHNSHLGDVRATEMARVGELNLGQLLRERHGDEVVSIGFFTHHGTVSAAADWGRPVERKRVRPALEGSYEQLFHRLGQPRFFLDLRELGEAAGMLWEARLERAIGVVYRPESERASHYFQAQLPGQFDAVLHFDETRAVEPLERTAEWERGELPETFPSSV
jgi:erythromycin esterase-like protein